MDIILKSNIKIVFTSAGDPTRWIPLLKSNNCVVAHVISSTKNAIKSINTGVDVLVAEGFEASGHNGREETTSMILLPAIRAIIKLPIIAAGSMYSGSSLLVALTLGANAIQVGSRFAIAQESSAHDNFKKGN